MGNETEKLTLDDRIETAKQRLLELNQQENNLEKDLSTIRSLKNQEIGRVQTLTELQQFETPNGDGTE
jgi:transcriptional antiterminator Rof (Rho-off)